MASEERISVIRDSEGWLRVCEPFSGRPMLVRAKAIDPKIKVVPDTGMHRAQQTTARGFVRVRPKTEYEIL